MILGVMRHGRAEPEGGDERRLTSEGIREVEAAAMKLPFRPVVIYTSPLKRAVETAEIVARIHGSEVRVEEGLRPGVFSVEVFERLAGDRVLLVGHNPSVSRVVSFITRSMTSLGTGWIAVLEHGAKGWRLASLIRP
ncbi:MAG: histidine phosphatase family protein [Desulfurococcales archaeon]|nr:histidine phosphatase family protein [Desulfurococcales archaeon]